MMKSASLFLVALGILPGPAGVFAEASSAPAASQIKRGGTNFVARGGRGRMIRLTGNEWGQPDPAPDPAALVERRFPIRRVFR